jgi:predicted RNase H-like nuclease (RuvC/YqgF family)
VNKEDIKLLLEIKANCLKDYGTTTGTYSDTKRLLKANAISNVLNEIERLNKENKELKEDLEEYQQIGIMQFNRPYAKRYLEEKKKEIPNLLYPDSEEIYIAYFDLKERIERLNKELEFERQIKKEVREYVKPFVELDNDIMLKGRMIKPVLEILDKVGSEGNGS